MSLFLVSYVQQIKKQSPFLDMFLEEYGESSVTTIVSLRVGNLTLPFPLMKSG